MPVLTDFGLCRGEDGVITVPMSPAVAVGGWTVRMVIQHRFGGISGTVKSCASGFINYTSGMTVVNSGQGIFAAQISSIDTSGLEFTAQTFTLERLDSGFRTQLGAGYFQVNPNPGF